MRNVLRIAMFGLIESACSNSKERKEIFLMC